MSKDKKKVLIALGVVLGLVGVITLSYAFLSVGGKQSLANTFTSGCLSITIENESNAISLNGAYPITDVEGLETEGYNFTINNTCSTSENYIINLENIDRQANSLSSDYLKISLNSDTFDNIITKLSSNEVTTPTISNAYEAYTIYKGKIEGNTTKAFKLREWLDYDATKEQAANKVIKNKINVIAKSDIEVEELLGIKTENIGSGVFTGGIGGELRRIKFNNVTNDEKNPFAYNEEKMEYTSTGAEAVIYFAPDKDYDNIGICYNISSQTAMYSMFGLAIKVDDETYQPKISRTVYEDENKCVNLGSVSKNQAVGVSYYSIYSSSAEKNEVTFYFTDYYTDKVSLDIMDSSAEKLKFNNSIDDSMYDNVEYYPFSYNEQTQEYTSTNKGKSSSIGQFIPDKNYDDIEICYDLSSSVDDSTFAFGVSSGSEFTLAYGNEENKCVNLGSVSTEDQIIVQYASNGTEANLDKDKVTFYFREKKKDVIKYCETKSNACTPNMDIKKLNDSISINMKDNGKQILCTSLNNGPITCSDSKEIINSLIFSNGMFQSDEFLAGNISREKIESITTLDKIEIPEGATSWDASQNGNQSIMAWYQDIDSNGLYEVYIGQKGGVTANSSSTGLFAELTELTAIDLKHFDTSNVQSMASMFQHDKKLTSLDLSNFDTSNVVNMFEMFEGVESLTSLDLSNFDTSNVTDMSYMFNVMKSLSSLNVSNFDTSKVTNMKFMFRETAIKNLDLSNFDTSNVENMYLMFEGMNSLTSLDLSNFDTRNVTSMSGMFSGMSSITSLDLSNFDTRNVTNMSSMFSGMSSITSLDLSNFDTRNVGIMSSMFSGMSSITSLDLSSFDTSKVTQMQNMFLGTSNLSSLKLDKATFNSVSNYSDMFTDSTVSSIYVKDTDAQTFINSRLSDAGKSANVITVS